MVFTIIQAVLFIAVSAFVFTNAFKAYKRIYRNIMLGKKEVINDNPQQRIKNVLLIALGQKKMFKNVIPALLHLVIYVSFVITQIELIEILIDGVSGQHRLIYHAVEETVFKDFYVFVIGFIEILSVLTFGVTIAFLWRRNILKLPRFKKPEMNGWPTIDANNILYFELTLITFIFMMNIGDGAKYFLKTGHSYGFAISSLFVPAFASLPEAVLTVIERVGWWGHILLVYYLLLYLPRSKHLHILLAFPNTYFSKLTPKGYMNNMPEITKEIKLMMNPDAAFAAPAEEPAEPVKFGAKDVFDLSWKNLLDAMSCTECGRCTAACPANQTGKLLSPRKIMMNTRDRLEEVANVIDANSGVWKEDGKSLIENGYISVEELRACTTCNACVEECPVTISPLDIILQLRRNLIMEESNAPAEWTGMFANMENNGAPWQFSQQDRLKWASES
ncbi:MAG: (Fe-S)-binding protein [Chitinophagales bacterium]|nr:(Fe-S)-binding protein [Chitinophagales bacterium]